MKPTDTPTFPEKLYVRSEPETNYWAAHLTQCSDEVEYIREDVAPSLIQGEIQRILWALKLGADYAKESHDSAEIESAIAILKDHLK